MKIIEMNKRGRYSHTLFGHKVVRLLLAASLQCGLFVPYVFGDNNLHINIMNQDGVVSGLVRDATGMPLIGVSVVVKGTMQGVVTDMDGKFSLEVPRGSVLVFSYIGMQSVEMSVTDQKDLNIVMKENSEAIDEIIVVGYGTVKKSNLSGAVSSVSSKDLQKLPAANLSQALQGNAPGLYSLQSSRDPGASVSLSIRGKNSFSGGDPLFIVDGFPIASGGGVNAINPNDIESVSILKDAFREHLMLESAWVLCFEGDRRFDLLRWGVYCTRTPEWNPQVKGNIQEGKHEFWPIPKSQRDVNVNLTQNPGW